MLKTVVYGGLNGMRRLGTQMVLETASLLVILFWIVVERDHLSLLLLFKIFGTVHLAAVGLGVPLFFLSLMRLPHRDPADAAGTREETGRYRYRPYLVWATGLGFVALAFSDVDRYLLAQLLTLEVLALFHIGARVGRLANRLLGVAHLAFQPEITRLNVEGRTSGIQPATRIFIKFNSTVAVLIMCAIVLFAREIIVVVASRDYLAATPLLIILALCLPLNTVTAPLTTVMKALDQIRGALITDVAWASTYLTLMVVLAPRFGLVGVGLAQLCACVLQLLVTLRISTLAIDLGFTAGLILRLCTAGAAAFLPVLLATTLARGALGGLIVPAKIVLFAGGMVVFRGLIRRMNIFTREERETLYGIFESRGIRVVRGVL
jgi:O-antigen/teichoic acid export membrane protein